MAKPIRVKGLDGLLANFRKFDEALREDVVNENEFWAADVQREAYIRAPKDTEFMADEITTEFSEQGLAFQVVIPVEPFTARGLAYYPKFVHDGTSRVAARPFMLEAFEARREDGNARMKAAYRRSVRRAL